MKFTIDTENKVINIEGKVTVLEILELVMVLNSDAEDYEVKMTNEEEALYKVFDLMFNPENFNTTTE
jgi:hypothetical protein